MPRAALCVALGTLAWVLLAVLPGRGGAQVSGGPYFWVIAGCGALVGVWLDGDPRIVGALLAGPGLVSAPWLAPRGDGDGLWVLWFAVIVCAGGGAGLAHWAAVRGWRQLRERRERR